MDLRRFKKLFRSKTCILMRQFLNTLFIGFLSFAYTIQAQDKSGYTIEVINSQNTSMGDIGISPPSKGSFYNTWFLTDDSWLATEDGDSKNIKYYEKGTFNNRFAQLPIDKYLELKNDMVPFSLEIFPSHGTAVFTAGKINDPYSKTGIYKYDFVTDKVTPIADLQKENYHLLSDFANNTLILSTSTFPDRYSNEMAQLELILNGSAKRIEGNYKVAKLSSDGSLILTVNADNLFEIRTTDNLKVINSQKIADGFYTVLSVEDSGFILVTDLRRLNEKGCSAESVFIEINKNEVKFTDAVCGLIKGVAIKEKIGGFIGENVGIVMGERILRFQQSEFPKNMSFNKDGSKLLVSLTNGQNVLYDTTTLKPLVYTIHPDRITHLFYDNENNFFSNTDPGEYLRALKNGREVSWLEMEKAYFQPEKILSKFGEPNRSYLAALQKALSLRKNTLYADGKDIEYVKQSQEIKPSSDKKGDLYLLSVGVSEYQNSNYNLTFADKDALDIMRLYGSLNEKETEGYNDKFYGNIFTVHSSNRKSPPGMNKYMGTYPRVGKFVKVGEDEVWMEKNDGKINLWYFNEKKIDSVSIPRDFKMPFDLVSEDTYFPIPSGNGFSVRSSDDTIFSYNTVTKKSKRYKLPFDTYGKSYTLIDEDKWIEFDYKHIDSTSTVSLTVHDVLNNKIIRKLNFNPHHYEEKEIDGSSKDIQVENHNSYIIPKLRSVSPAGKHLIYSTDLSLFFVDLTKTNLKPVKIVSNHFLQDDSEISLALDGKTFGILNKDGDNYTATIHDIYGKQLEIHTFEDKGSIKGVSIQNANPQWITMADALLQDNYFLAEANQLLNSARPFSFNKVFTASLVNQKADSRSIANILSDFLKKTNVNDQVVLFMAGHGMLDSKNKYFFAPHNMDFGKPEANGIAFESIVNSLKNTPAKNKLLILDTCHSGNTLDVEAQTKTKVSHSKAGARGSEAITLTEPKYKVSDITKFLLADFLSTSGVTIISAASGGDLALEHPGWGNGALTKSFMEMIKRKLYPTLGITSLLKVEDLKRPVKMSQSFIDELLYEVQSVTDGKQAPDLRELNKEADIYVW